MRRLIIVFFALLIGGCAGLDLLSSGDPLFTLSPYPKNSGCYKDGCKKLDALEAKGYELARSGKLKWVKFVDVFYTERDKLFPNAEETNDSREYRAYQRVLAEKLDNKQMSESEWVYALEKMNREQDNRSEALRNSRPRKQNCITEKVGLPPFEKYQTRCE